MEDHIANPRIRILYVSRSCRFPIGFSGGSKAPDGINNRNFYKRRFRGAVRRRHHLSTTLRAPSPRPLPLESVAQTLAASCWLSVVLRRSSTKGAIVQLRRQPPPQTKRQRSSRRTDGAPAKLTKKEKTNACTLDLRIAPRTRRQQGES